MLEVVKCLESSKMVTITFVVDRDHVVSGIVFIIIPIHYLNSTHHRDEALDKTVYFASHNR